MLTESKDGNILFQILVSACENFFCLRFCLVPLIKESPSLSRSVGHAVCTAYRYRRACTDDR